jgi:hypothetical protein
VVHQHIIVLHLNHATSRMVLVAGCLFFSHLVHNILLPKLFADMEQPSRMEAEQIHVTSQKGFDSAFDLYNAIQMIFSIAAAGFESKWAAAHGVCHAQVKSAKDDAHTRTVEFEALKMLDPKIIPFIVFKLAKPNAGQNLWAASLCKLLGLLMLSC